jgi:cbb3-type cytochrome oxidase subunit 3
VAGYTAGRFWIELMRTDPATTVFGGIRINVVVAATVFVLAVVYIVWAPRGREVVDTSNRDTEGMRTAIRALRKIPSHQLRAARRDRCP